MLNIIQNYLTIEPKIRNLFIKSIPLRFLLNTPSIHKAATKLERLLIYTWMGKL